MKRSATRNLVAGLGLLIFGLYVVQDVEHFYQSITSIGWTSSIIGEAIGAAVRNLLLLLGLGLVILRRQTGWTLLALLALFTLIPRAAWFFKANSAFDSLSSLAFQGAFSAADLLFQMLCLTVLVDLVRDSRPRTVQPEEPGAPAATDAPVPEEDRVAAG